MKEKKQVEEICGIPSEMASLMDSFSCQLRREMNPGKINSWYGHAELDRKGEGGVVGEQTRHFLRIPSLSFSIFCSFGHACIQAPQHLLAISILIRQSGHRQVWEAAYLHNLIINTQWYIFPNAFVQLSFHPWGKKSINMIRQYFSKKGKYSFFLTPALGCMKN